MSPAVFEMAELIGTFRWTQRLNGARPLVVMPLLGYLGYLPFGLELYPMTHLLLAPPPAVKL